MKTICRFSTLCILGFSFLFYSSCASTTTNGFDDQDFEDSIKKSYRVGSGGTLNIETDVGSIEVQAGGGNHVKVEVFREVDARSKGEIEDILFLLEHPPSRRRYRLVDRRQRTCPLCY